MIKWNAGIAWSELPVRCRSGIGVQHPSLALAAGGRSRRCSGFILERRAVLGLHPWASGLPAATVLSPVSPAAVFSIRRVIRYHKLWSLPWCWRTLFFQHSPPVLQDEGLLAPFFRMCFIMLNTMNIELKIPCMEPDSNIYCTWEMCNRA